MKKLTGPRSPFSFAASSLLLTVAVSCAPSEDSSQLLDGPATVRFASTMTPQSGDTRASGNLYRPLITVEDTSWRARGVYLQSRGGMQIDHDGSQTTVFQSLERSTGMLFTHVEETSSWLKAEEGNLEKLADITRLVILRGQDTTEQGSAFLKKYYKLGEEGSITMAALKALARTPGEFEPEACLINGDCVYSYQGQEFTFKKLLKAMIDLPEGEEPIEPDPTPSEILNVSSQTQIDSHLATMGADLAVVLAGNPGNCAPCDRLHATVERGVVGTSDAEGVAFFEARYHNNSSAFPAFRSHVRAYPHVFILNGTTGEVISQFPGRGVSASTLLSRIAEAR